MLFPILLDSHSFRTSEATEIERVSKVGNAEGFQREWLAHRDEAEYGSDRLCDMGDGTNAKDRVKGNESVESQGLAMGSFCATIMSFDFILKAPGERLKDIKQ